MLRRVLRVDRFKESSGCWRPVEACGRSRERCSMPPVRTVDTASDYTTPVVPARAGHAKDKAVIEDLVEVLIRYVRARHRRQRVTSIAQINQAIGEGAERINARPQRASASRTASGARPAEAPLAGSSPTRICTSSSMISSTPTSTATSGAFWD